MRPLSLSRTFIIMTYTRISEQKPEERHHVRNTAVSTSFFQSNKIVHGEPAEIRLDYMQYKGVGEVADRARRILALVCLILLACLAYYSTLKTEAIYSSKTLLFLHQPTRRHHFADHWFKMESSYRTSQVYANLLTLHGHAQQTLVFM